MWAVHPTSPSTPRNNCAPPYKVSRQLATPSPGLFAYPLLLSLVCHGGKILRDLLSRLAKMLDVNDFSTKPLCVSILSSLASFELQGRHSYSMRSRLVPGTNSTFKQLPSAAAIPRGSGKANAGVMLPSRQSTRSSPCSRTTAGVRWRRPLLRRLSVIAGLIRLPYSRLRRHSTQSED